MAFQNTKTFIITLLIFISHMMCTIYATEDAISRAGSIQNTSINTITISNSDSIDDNPTVFANYLNNRMEAGNDTFSSHDMGSQFYDTTSATKTFHTSIRTMPSISTPTIVSCKGKCGVITQYPCSCDVKCLVHRNCCENMATDCPGIIDEARSRFDALLRSDVICSEHEYFMISSCPRDGDLAVGKTSAEGIAGDQYVTPGVGAMETSKHTLSDNSSHTQKLSVNGFQTPSPENDPPKSSYTSIIDFLLTNTPVLDLSTGFVFLNESIFLCHGGNRSAGLLWNVELQAIDPQEDPLTVDILNRAFNQQNVIKYSLPPSFSSDTIAPARCIFKVIDTCSSEREEPGAELRGLCQSFFSYGKVGTHFYANRFCFECSMDYQLTLEVIFEWKLHLKFQGLSALFELSVVNENIAVDIRANQMPHEKSFPWSEAVCKIGKMSNKNFEEDNLLNTFHELSLQQVEQICAIESCTPGFQKHPDGTCKMRHELSMAFANDGYPFTPTEKAGLPRVVGCFLEKVFDLDIDVKNLPSETVFDTRLNRILYLIKMNVFLPHDATVLYLVSNFDTQQSKLSTLAKFLRDQRKERSRLECNPSRQTKPGASPRNSSYISDSCVDNSSEDDEDIDGMLSITSKDMMDIYLGLKIYFSRGKVLDNTTTTMCCTNHPLSMPAPPLECWEDKLYEFDAEIMKEFANSHCIALFQDDTTNGVELLRSTWVWLYQKAVILALLICYL